MNATFSLQHDFVRPSRQFFSARAAARTKRRRHREQLKELRLSGLAQSLEVRLHEAKSSKLNHAEFLEMILDDELVVRRDRQIERRTKTAAFRDQKSIDDFDFEFNTSVRRKQIYDLAAGDFVRKHHDAILVGPPGVGKSHIVQSIGRQLIRDGFTVYYRSIFDCVRDDS